MQSFDTTLPSHDLDSEFDVIVYGTAGTPVIAFPTFDFSAGSWENGGMVACLTDLIEEGRIQLFTVDSADGQSWYARNSDLAYRAERQCGYLSFVADELLAYVKKTNPTAEKPLLAGCGVGAINATAALFRDPSRWGGLMALSGAYDARFYSDGATTDEWLSCSPIDLLEGMTNAQIAELKALPLAFVCGQSAGEHGIETQRQLDALATEKDLGATFEYWGTDVSHDWGWWQQMAAQFLPALIEPAGLARRKYDYVKSRAESAAHHLAEVKALVDDAMEEERAAETRVEDCEREVDAKAKAADEAAELARGVWDKRNALAEQLAAIDKQANELQAAADAAAHERSDAEWYAGEARARLEMAASARTEAEDRAKVAQAEADKADAARKLYEDEVVNLEAAAHKATEDPTPAKSPSPAKANTAAKTAKTTKTVKAAKPTRVPRKSASSAKKAAPSSQKPSARKNAAKRPAKPTAKKQAPKAPAAKGPDPKATPQK